MPAVLWSDLGEAGLRREVIAMRRTLLVLGLAATLAATAGGQWIHRGPHRGERDRKMTHF
ncbi:MAG: hypothetical protein JXQ29_11335 [Planctomycetes bacterium]|nr:hypothetical protein [Planctomycetota bacterium]